MQKSPKNITKAAKTTERSRTTAKFPLGTLELNHTFAIAQNLKCCIHKCSSFTWFPKKHYLKAIRLPLNAVILWQSLSKLLSKIHLVSCNQSHITLHNHNHQIQYTIHELYASLGQLDNENNWYLNEKKWTNGGLGWNEIKNVFENAIPRKRVLDYFTRRQSNLFIIFNNNLINWVIKGQTSLSTFDTNNWLIWISPFPLSNAPQINWLTVYISFKFSTYVSYWYTAQLLRINSTFSDHSRHFSPNFI